MTPWQRQRDAAQLTVHRQFAVPGVYVASALGAPPVEVHVRHHSRVVAHGDLESGGYAQTVDDVNVMTFDATEVAPEKRAVVEFADGRRFMVETVHPAAGRFVRCDVTGLRSAPR